MEAAARGNNGLFHHGWVGTGWHPESLSRIKYKGKYLKNSDKSLVIKPMQPVTRLLSSSSDASKDAGRIRRQSRKASSSLLAGTIP